MESRSVQHEVHPVKARPRTPPRISRLPTPVEVKKAGRFALSASKGCAFVQTPPLGHNRGKSLMRENRTRRYFDKLSTGLIEELFGTFAHSLFSIVV